jgi:hypothetical protein
MPVLEAGLAREPGNTEILAALAQYSIALGRHEEAGAWVERLAGLAPGDPMVMQLRSALDAARAEADSKP